MKKIHINKISISLCHYKEKSQLDRHCTILCQVSPILYIDIYLCMYVYLMCA